MLGFQCKFGKFLFPFSVTCRLSLQLITETVEINLQQSACLENYLHWAVTGSTSESLFCIIMHWKYLGRPRLLIDQSTYHYVGVLQSRRLQHVSLVEGETRWIGIYCTFNPEWYIVGLPQKGTLQHTFFWLDIVVTHDILLLSMDNMSVFYC